MGPASGAEGRRIGRAADPPSKVHRDHAAEGGTWRAAWRDRGDHDEPRSHVERQAFGQAQAFGIEGQSPASVVAPSNGLAASRPVVDGSSVGGLRRRAGAARRAAPASSSTAR